MPTGPKMRSMVAHISAAYLAAVCDAVDDWTLSAQHLNLLMSLQAHGSLHQHDIPKHTRVTKSSVSRNILRLGPGSPREKGLGLVEVSADPEDRRYNIVRLTPLGISVMEEAANRAAERMAAAPPTPPSPPLNA